MGGGICDIMESQDKGSISTPNPNMISGVECSVAGVTGGDGYDEYNYLL